MRIYFASKMKHAAKWVKWAAENPRHHMASRWPYLHGIVPDSAEHAQNFWVDDVRDVLFSDALIVYAEPDDNLRGALVEIGVAIANDILVIVIGEHTDYGTWQYHPSVSRANTLDRAIKIIEVAERDLAMY